MNTQDIISSGIIESYVLGTASPEEMAMLDCMQQSFPEIKAAVAEAQQSVERLAAHLAVSPSAGLKERIWSRLEAEEIKEEPKAAPVAAPAASVPVQEPKTKTISWKTWAVAASVFLTLSLGTNIYFQQESARKDQQLSTITAQQQEQALKMVEAESRIALLNQPHIKVVRLKGSEQHASDHAVVFWNEETKQVHLDAAALPKAPEGKQYQLWAMVNGQPVDAGLYTAGQDIGKVLSTIPNAEAFAITLEKAGGSPVPDLTQLYVIGPVS